MENWAQTIESDMISINETLNIAYKKENCDKTTTTAVAAAATEN